MSFLTRLRDLLMTIVAAISRRNRGGGGGGVNPAQPYAASIVLSAPSSGTTVIATHQTTPFGVVVKDQDLNVMTNQTYGFLSSDEASGSITADGVVTGVTGVSGGTTNITARLTNSRGQVITSNAIAITVAAQVATSPIAVDPSSATLSEDGSLQMAAVVSDQGSPANVIAGASVTWSRSGTKCTVGALTGLVQGASAGAGSSTITATSGSATGTCALTISAQPHVVTSVSMSPTTLTTTVGGTPTVVGTVLDEDGNPMPGEAVLYTSGTPSHVTVDLNTGQCTGVALGGAIITATSVTDPTKTATCTVTVSSINWASLGVHPDASEWDNGANPLYAGANDAARTAALQANISTAVGGTNSSGTALYNAGSNGAYASVTSVVPGTASDILPGTSTSIKFQGNPVLAWHQPASTGITPQLWHNLYNDLTALWFRARYLFPPGWTNQGSGSGGGAGYKRYAFSYAAGISTRFGDEITDGGEIMTMGVNASPPFPSPSGITSDGLGYHPNAMPWTAAQAVWRDLIWCWYPVSPTLYRRMLWEANDGSVPVFLADTYMMMHKGTFPAAHQVMIGLNKNRAQTATQDQYIYQGQWEVVPYSVNPDPWGLIALAGGDIDTMRIANASTITGVSGLPAAGGSSTITITGTNLNRGSIAYMTLQLCNVDPLKFTGVFGTKTLVNSTTITCTLNATSLPAGTYYISACGLGNGWATAQSRPFAFTLV